MNEKALRILEFPKITERLESCANSGPGKALCRSLLPSDDLDEICRLQQETTDALSRIYRKGSVSFAGVSDLRPCIKRLEIGGMLSITELLGVVRLLDACSRVKSYSRSERQERQSSARSGSGRAFSDRGGSDRAVSARGGSGRPFSDREAEAEGSSSQDSLDPLFSCLEPLTPLSQEIHRCILSEDEIADDASPALRQIRRSMNVAHDRIRSVLTGMVNGSARSYLQDAVITQRNGRFCLPVKAEHRSSVPGMIHDQSSSGSTLFIEPMAVVKLNNDLRELELSEEREIAVILSTLSSMVAEKSDVLAENISILTQLDFIFARAMLSKSYNGFPPDFNEEGIIDIRKGRHPLLDPAKVVPVDIRIGKDFDLLVISGPNTGGKTVSLKTVGLFTLMGQAGLHIPAAEHSSLSVFKEVFADIGDEQSIEQSLSTFSSHMTNIVSFWTHADEHSLVLFDELGAGTDPTEGAALAIAILSDLHSRGIRTIATTHYSELKIFALSTPGVENACCEFDVDTLRPTYRLLIGIPGKSNAFAISSKLGLPSYIIDEAKKHISSEAESFEDVVADLEDKRKKLETDREMAEKARSEAESLRSAYAARQSKLDNSREKILAQAREEAQSILREAKEFADETIRSYNRLGSEKDSSREMERMRTRLREKMKEMDQSGLSARNKAQPSRELTARDLHIGDSVRVISMNLKGTVSTLPDAKGNLFVQMGILRSSVKLNDLELLEEEPSSPILNKSSAGKIRMSKSSSVGTEINLLGKTVDEALTELDKYLDDAYMAHIPGVRIVHGKGTGALRKAVHQYLRKQKHVKEFRLGEFGEGDSGVTIVTFK